MTNKTSNSDTNNGKSEQQKPILINNHNNQPLPIYIKIKINDLFKFTAQLERVIGNNFHLKHIEEQIKIHFNSLF